jgi:hypothetical protein
VAVAPKHATPAAPRSIAVGFDGGPESRGALALARDWAREHSVVRGRAGAELVRAAETVDLLVVGSRGWGPLSRVALGSTSDWLTHHAPCPVIVVPRPDAAGEHATAPLAGATHA